MSRKNLSKRQRQQSRIGLKGAFEMEIPEIARSLGITQNAVKKTLKTAMKKLRDGRAEKFRDLMIAREMEKKVNQLTVGTE